MELKLPEFPKVKILECHAMPDLVGREARIILFQDPETAKYPVQVMLLEPMTVHMKVQIPFGPITEIDQEVVGPFPFRPDELELIVETPPVQLPDFLGKGFEGIELDPTKPAKPDDKENGGKENG